MHKLPLLLAFCLLPCAFLNGQTRISDDPEEVLEVFEAMYQYNMAEAEEMFWSLSRSRINSNLIDLTHVNLLWWWLISGDETRNYDEEMEMILHRLIAELKAKPVEKMSQDEVFTIVHAYAYLTRVDVYKERYLKGIANLSQTLKSLKIILGQTYRYDKFMMVTGLWNYFAAATMTEYPLFIPFFVLAPKSNKNLGYKLLQECSEMKNLLIRNEALYYMMKVNYQLERKFDEALGTADQLTLRYPNNLIYHFHKFMILFESGQKAKAIEQYQVLLQVSTQAPGLSPVQRNHLVEIARKRMVKEKINPAL